MKESLSSIDNRVIFRETFNSFDDISKNGGTLGVTATISNGQMIVTADTSVITYNQVLNGTFSVRIRTNQNTQNAWRYLLELGAGNANYVAINNSNALTSNAGTKYVNGVAATAFAYNKNNKIVVAGITFNNLAFTPKIRIGSAGFPPKGTIDLIEIYQGTLTATEVAELYKNDLYTFPTSAKDYTFNCNFINGYINETKGAVMTNTGNIVTKDGGVNSLVGTASSTLYSDKAISTLMSSSLGTISVWCKPTGTPVTKTYSYDGQTAVCDNTGLSGGYTGIMRAIIGGLDRIWVYNWDGNEDKVGIPYTNGEWVNIVWIHSGGQLYGYKNGVLVGQVASGNTQFMIYLFSIGQRFGATATNWVGRIGEVKVWNRALTQTEITRLYNSQKNLYK